jgi:hypothetical protein
VVHINPATTVTTPNTTQTSINNLSQCMNPPGPMKLPSGGDYRANPLSWERCKCFPINCNRRNQAIYPF